MAQSYSFTNTTTLGDNSSTTMLNTAPTLTVSRSTADPITKSINMTGILAVNFIAGMNAILQSATLPSGTATLLFLNSQPGVVNLSLDNGGTIGGLSIYLLQFGAPALFQWSGTNLS